MTPKHPWLRVGLCLATLGLGSLASAQKSADDAKAELKTIENEFQQELKSLKQATQAAADDKAAEAIHDDFSTHILPEFAERFAALARSVKGTDEGLAAWLQVVDLAAQARKGDLAKEALDALAQDHIESAKLAHVADSLRYRAEALGEETVIGALKAFAERSTQREVKAAALFNLGAVLSEERPAGDPKLAEARAVLGSLADFADVKYMDGRSYADAGQAILFALDNLVPGKPCPEFAATDAEGASFKLSDYKGKVVLVDFWGFW